MSRAAAWTESAGIPAVAIACRGFATTVRLVARSEGLSDIRLVEYPPPNIAVQNPAQVHEYAARLVDEVIVALSKPPSAAQAATRRTSAKLAEIAFRGSFEEVNDFFRQNVWSDGLPIAPPTVKAVEAMLGFTDRAPEDVVGILPPQRLAATVWSIAVNGVMAGCRPEYMPVLLAVVEAIAEPRFGLEHAGSTVGWSPLIVLNGPIIKELGFNYGLGVLRPQAQANITVSRFLRLCMVNIAGYRLGETDMATFGRNYYPVLAEAEDESPWPPLSVDRGFEKGANVVTVQSAVTISQAFLSEGDGKEHLRLIAQEVARELGGSNLVPMERFGGEVCPLICLSPLVAGIVSRAGYTKNDIRQYLFDHARVTAREFDERLGRHRAGLNLHEAVRAGTLPPIFALSHDPDRLVPVVHKPEEYSIVVSGAPTRNRSFVAAQIGYQGLSVSREIRLPKHWKASLP